MIAAGDSRYGLLMMEKLMESREKSLTKEFPLLSCALLQGRRALGPLSAFALNRLPNGAIEAGLAWASLKLQKPNVNTIEN